MHYQKEIWRGQHTLTLTEDAMTLRLLPERGGKAASLQWRGVELNVPVAVDPLAQYFGAIGAALWAYNEVSK